MWNLVQKHLASSGAGPETLEHVFCQCPVSVGVWGLVDRCKEQSTTSIRRVEDWVPPPPEVYKANFDVAFDQANSRSGSRVVIRNSIGQVLASTAVLHANVVSVFFVEALVCSDAVRACKGLGLRKVIVEGDSLTVIKKCTSALNDSTPIGTNKLADRLATESLKRDEEFYLLGSMSSFAKAIQVDKSIRELD
ncbi:hypothetical protein Gogos_015560 [Gossypium gossypioides]|uniref:RNase H type-1 domain-containing protein n=1 Tax=Gossypium gossypioides TaxID=34282 RepID=A0A7J9C236_GOSGO|nr:hypothetical protein [Gossypium gossypioides]